MKKMFLLFFAVMMLVGCNETPTASIEKEGVETIITESILEG